MAEFHTLPIKTDSYLADTRHLTAAQHGAYFLLLMMAWRSSGNDLPNDDDTLARWACMDRRTWLHNKDMVMAFWTLGPDARWRQKKLDETRKYVGDLVSKKSAAGTASALKRKRTSSTPVQQQLQQKVSSESESESQSERKLASSKDDSAGKADGPALSPVCDTEVLPSGWQDLAEVRGIPNDQIFRSWRRFKEISMFPYRIESWKAWLARERVPMSSN